MRLNFVFVQNAVETRDNFFKYITILMESGKNLLTLVDKIHDHDNSF